MSKKESTAVSTEVFGGAVATLSDDLKAVLAQNAGAGLEEIGADGFALPFLKLVQSLSPERDEDSDQYIEGAKEGMLFDTVTRELFDGKSGIEVIPVHIRQLVIEWTPRNQGGGFVAEYASREEAEEYVTPGNELRDTITYTVLYRPVGSDRDFQPALLGMESTKLKVARTWNSQLRMLKVPVEIDGELQRINPPSYMTVWRMTATKQENNKGKFFNFQIVFDSLVEDVSVVSNAEQLREAVSNRTLRGKDGDVEEPEVGEGGSDNF